jgi:hypothetical protein
MSTSFTASFRRLPLALAVFLPTIGLIALACSGGSSPTEPATPSSGQNSANTSGGLTGGEPTTDPKITVEKSTNGEDADQGTGPEIVVGDPVLWEYVITNTGGVLLTNITLNDDKIGDMDCPKDALAAGESMTCSAEGIAERGQYRNVARVRGTAPDKTEVGDKDNSHYLGVEPDGKPNIRIEKSTNGEDADAPTGPIIPVGDPVVWTYEVTNTGDVTLTDIVVTDNQIGDIDCPMTTLDPSESMTCTAEGVAEEGQYRNEGRVVGIAPDGTEVADKDRSHYLGEEEETGAEGCSHGYWKNHIGSWAPTGYSPGDIVENVFSSAAAIPSVGEATLLQALNFGGGPGVEGAARNLLKQAVGSLLNAAHPDVDFPSTESEVIDMVNSALDTQNRQVMLSLAGDLDFDNNLGCPLN